MDRRQNGNKTVEKKLRECYTFLGSIFSFALCVSEADLKHLEGIYAFQRIPIDSRKPWSEDAADAGQSVLSGFQPIMKGETHEREQRVQK